LSTGESFPDIVQHSGEGRAAGDGSWQMGEQAFYSGKPKMCAHTANIPVDATFQHIENQRVILN
jgi:hypothetical protein